VNLRRCLLLALGAGIACPMAPARAQAPAAGTLRRVGVLAPSTRAKEEVTLKPFFDEMRQLGWIDGQTIAYERAYADDATRTLDRLAAELVARKPELIYAPPSVAAVAAKQATRIIPIIFGTGTDPVGIGLVASLARPGGNVTGVVNTIDSLAPKRVELLLEIMPGARRLGLLGDPTETSFVADRNALASVAPALGLTIVVAEASSPAEFDSAAGKLLGQRIDAMLATSAISGNLRHRLIELTHARRVPVVGQRAFMAEAGALFSYGASVAGQLRRSAHLVDQVLKGAKPADLAVEQPTRFELVINLIVAKALGLTIPQSLLLRADEVIQ
jgi:putative tryptophan/tyrosine transport system substrate-binding protein